MKHLSDDLALTVTRAAGTLHSMAEPVAEQPVAPGKWSRKQIVGHLVDSASNNHQRFVRAQFQDDLEFPGYAQDDWMAAQQYQAASWRELIDLWRAFNLHLARIIARIPPEIAERGTTRHNLHEIAWETPAAEASVTLEFFVGDYLNHLKHHLRQIDPTLADPPVLQLAQGSTRTL